MDIVTPYFHDRNGVMIEIRRLMSPGLLVSSYQKSYYWLVLGFNLSGFARRCHATPGFLLE